MDATFDDRRLREMRSELELLHHSLESIRGYLDHVRGSQGQRDARLALDAALEMGRIFRDLEYVPTVLPINLRQSSAMDRNVRSHLKRVSRLCTKVGHIRDSHDVFDERSGRALDELVCAVLRETRKDNDASS